MRSSTVQIVNAMTNREPISRSTFTKSVVAMTLAIGAAAACAPDAGKSQSITIEVDAPAGLTPDIIVKGPGGYERTVHESGTIEGVPAGEYTVKFADRRVRLSQPIVDSVWAGSVTGSPAQVTNDSGATVSVRFDREPGSGRIWVPIANEDRVVSFSAEDLAGNAAPSIELTAPPGSGPDAVAFDGRGNMWVSMTARGTVVQVAMADLGKSGPLVVSKTIEDVEGVEGIAFDGSGDLWLARSAKNELVSFTDVLYGTPTKKRAVTVAGSPWNVAFDAGGDLFVATREPASIVVFAKEALGAGKPLPKAMLRGPASGLVSPSGVAFDSAGNLWVSNGPSNGAVRFDFSLVSTLSGEMDGAPNASLAAGEDGALRGLAVDNTGAGWFSMTRPSGSELARAPDLLMATPSLGPGCGLRSVTPAALGLARPAFDPPPRTVPIRR